MAIVVYHNPECGTSRNVVDTIRTSGVEPIIIEYLKTGDPPPLNWSTVYFSKRRIEDGNQTTQTGRNCLEAASS